MDLSFPQYSEEGQQLILRARSAAAEALKEKVRHDGTPFIGHPDAVARIVADEIGLPAECVAAVYLHEGSRMAELEINPREWDESIVTMVDGLNKISTINPKDTRL
ncbi:MAG: HD domain-containing protein, partial [Bacteroidales bacterium]|nr:HD domain-containing protein [Bacteroidales bacterium]